MVFLINLIRVLLIYWIISTVIRFVRNMRQSGGGNPHVRNDRRPPNSPVDPDMPSGKIEDADFEEIDGT